MNPGKSYRIFPGTIHRINAIEDSEILEESTSDLDDIVRLEERYGREETNKS